MRPEQPSFLTPEQKLREQEVITKCFNLMRDERSRYEMQAESFLANQFMASKIGVYSLTYSIQVDLFTCEVIPKSYLEESVTLQVPIPPTRSEQIETLIELFAQSEAGFIS